MTCVLLMIECIYGHDGMDGGIPNEVTLHRCLLSNIPFMPVERQQHLSLFMKNYQSPFENIFIFLCFPPCSLQRLCACAAFQLQQMFFHHLGHRQRLVTMSYTFISFAQNSGSLFLPLTSQPPGDGFFPPHLCFVNTLPYIKQHIISFN